MTEKSQPRTFPSSSKKDVAKSENGCNEKVIKKVKVKKLDSDEDMEDYENELTDDERQLFMEEFRSSMFNSFLEGKDEDFDYE